MIIEGLINFNRKAYDGIYPKYENLHPEIFNPVEQDRLQNNLDKAVRWIKTPSMHKVAFDYGCGSGNLSRHFINLGLHVIAVDVSENFVKFVKEKYENTGMLVNAFKVNGRDLGNIDDNVYDLVGCYSVLHHIPDYLRIIEEFIRVLKPGGVFYLDHERNDSFWNNDSGYCRLLRLAYPRKTWKRYFKLENYIFKLKRIINPRFAPEGDIHVWKDDRIEWGKIENLLYDKGCEIIFKEDYLLYRGGYPVDLYQEFVNKGYRDMRLLIIRKKFS